MKIKPLLQSINPSTFEQDYLTACGVEDVDKYLKADQSSYDNPWDYPNMKDGVERLHQALNENETIGVLVDCDCDGNCSASLIYNFIKSISPNQSIKYFLHTGKQHGLVQSKEEDIVQQIIDNEIKLMIIPDAGSNDSAQCAYLKSQGIDCLILDHHEITSDNPHAILVNHHLGEGLNTALSGTGVVYKFVQAYCEYYDYVLDNSYVDLVATSIVTDMCDMTSVENYGFVKIGFANLTNPMLKAMFEAFNSRGNHPIGVAWGVGPKINAVYRDDDMETKEALFKAMVGEYDIDEAINLLKAAHKEQTDVVKQVVKKLEPTLDVSHKVIIGYIDEGYKGYSGLIANKLTGEYNKPSLVLRELNPTVWTGSIRSPIDIAKKINESGLAKCQGHEAAAGIFIKKSNLDKLTQWFEQLDLSTETIKLVTAQIKPQDIKLPLCKFCQDNMLMWGASKSAKVTQPKFYLKFETTPDKVTVFKKKTKTVKFDFGGASILKFMAKAEDVEMLESGKCKVEAVVTLEVNSFNGVESPQAKVETWEIAKIDELKIDEDWESLF